MIYICIVNHLKFSDMTEIVKTTTVARINKVDILVIENGEKRVAITPICDALGIASNNQIERIKNDPILGSTHMLSISVGADGKERQMSTIPFKYVFGWLFLIDSRNVKEEAREAVLKYQIECYDALYEYFTGYSEFVEEKQKAIDAQLEIEREARRNFNSAKTILKEAESTLYKISKLTYGDYDVDRRQLKMFTDNEMKGEN